MDTHKIKKAVKEIVFLITNGDIKELSRKKMLGPSTAKEYTEALTKYLINNKCLVMPPDTAFEKLDIYDTKEEGAYRVDFDLWDKDGACDLTAQIYVKQLSNLDVTATLYDLRVL